MQMDNAQFGGNPSPGTPHGETNTSGSTSGSTSFASIGTDAENAKTESIGGMARNLATQAQQKAGEQVRTSIDKGRNRAAGALQEVARTLMATDELNQNPAAPYMNRAGEEVRRVADYLQHTDLRQMVTHTEQLARRQPALFLGSAFAIGVLAARFLKSSRPDSGRTDDGEYGHHDRERSLAHYRETSGYGTTAGNKLTSDDIAWPSSLSGMDSSPSDIGPTSRR